ncbi:caspase family protein [Bradyrhizobium diazoefficiens]|nr:caspase domain-containing protein [Bradyrhizobium diazoefficiens]MBR0814741.1 caspase family protein [Bradyrhizobium diazoefficiens]
MRGTLRVFICLFLPIVIVAAGAPGPVRAQQQEKRIALVVGNGAYAKSPLATTANDAGLIAQTLQAAGFDVVGARDLDGDTLRKSFRDFVQKAQASGPGTVAMVYLAGYGVQLAGENYFIPVDSNITRDTDIPTEALRISDYARQLAAIPLKANIVVLDAARAQPFIEGGQPIASGLALVEPDANMLIAFNAAPGTAAPEEAGPYGIYAQSLAEMIRTGGLPLAEVFDRVRLRVNEASKGAQVPWNEQKITAPFSFFERGPDAPPEAANDQVAAIRSKPIRDLGVQDAYAAALERDTLPAYEEFLAAYPGDPLAKRVRAIAAARREAITWRRTYRTDTPEAYWSYLRRYPRGPHAADARRRLAILTAPPEPPPTFAMIDYDVPPPPPEEVFYVDRPVLYFGDPDFGFAPPPPPPVYYLPPPPPDFVVLSPPLPVIGLFVLPQPVFVPIPVFVRPPLYVAPPPNNIIYQNIHNTTVINTVINRPPPPPTGAGPAPGNLAPAVAGRANPAGPAVPQAVVQRATLIQQGKAPMPPSSTIQPTARPGIAAPGPANVAPAAIAQPPVGAKPPQANTLPAPGTPGAPPAGAGAAPGAVAPGGTPSPTATAPAGNAAVTPQAPAPAKLPQADKLPQANTLPTPGTPGGPPPPARPGGGPGAAPSQGKPVATTTPPAGTIPPAQPNAATTPAPNQPVPGGAPAPSAGLPRPGASPPSATDPRGRPGGAQPGVLPSPSTAGRPAIPTPVRPATPLPPPVAAREPSRIQDHRPAPPPQAARPVSPSTPPQALARPTPPPRVAPPPPPRAAPPPVAARPAAPPPMARPAPPPPMVRAAPPAPPPPMARPAPPPPPVARPAPPPMAAAPPRMAAPPPPPARPAGPAPRACPPGQPRC